MTILLIQTVLLILWLFTLWSFFEGSIKSSIIFDAALGSFFISIITTRFVSNFMNSGLYQGVGWGLSTDKLPLFWPDLSIQPFMQFLPLLALVLVSVLVFASRRIRISGFVVDRLIFTVLIIGTLYWSVMAFAGIQYGAYSEGTATLALVGDYLTYVPVLQIRVLASLVILIMLIVKWDSKDYSGGRQASLVVLVLSVVEVLLRYSYVGYESNVINTFDFVQLALIAIFFLSMYYYIAIGDNNKLEEVIKSKSLKMVRPKRDGHLLRTRDSKRSYSNSFSKTDTDKIKNTLTWQERIRKGFNTLKRRVSR